MDSYETQIQTFLSDLIRYQGYHLRVPRPFRKDKYEATSEARKEIWKKTCELLEMMGIAYRTNLTALTICVIEVGDDWTKEIGR